MVFAITHPFKLESLDPCPASENLHSETTALGYLQLIAGSAQDRWISLLQNSGENK